MTEIPFHMTQLGRRYYEHSVPELVRQVTRLADALERTAVHRADEAADRPSEGPTSAAAFAVGHRDPWTGEAEAMPFGDRNLSPGDPAMLGDLADRYERLAADLRRLAADGTSRPTGELPRELTDAERDEARRDSDPETTEKET